MDREEEDLQRVSSYYIFLHQGHGGEGIEAILMLFTFSLRLWGTFTDAMAPSESADLKEDLGIEFDSEEHVELEKLLGPGALTSFRRK